MLQAVVAAMSLLPHARIDSRLQPRIPEAPHSGGFSFARRSALTILAGSAFALPASGAAAVGGGAVDLVTQVGTQSIAARTLQLSLRDAAPIRGSKISAARRRLARERPGLQDLLTSMELAAPDLRICAAERADCDCDADPKLMAAAQLQVDVVRLELGRLDAALAQGPEAFEELVTSGGAVVYPSGAAEQALEAICEAADTYLDLASGRPLMTARIAPLR
jgi:hypothetical protein